MSAVQQELIDRITRLNSEQQGKVLAFVKNLEPRIEPKAYTLEELKAMLPDERERAVAAAIALSADEDFEIFEANEFFENYDEAI